MTLAELLPIAQQLSAVDKLRLVRLLVEDLDSIVSMIETDHTYRIHTPYDQYGAADALLQAFPSIYAGAKTDVGA